MPKTIILYPLDETSASPQHSQLVTKITAFLNEAHTNNKQIDFDEFLVSLGIDFNTYIEVIRSTLKRVTVFLKRSLAETRINNYNTVLMKCWMANMDLQYILDPYACVSYIVSYISKGQRGLSNLLADACFEAQSKDTNIREQVRRIGNQFLTNIEIGAREAVYLVLQMPLRRCTRQVIYVDTNQSNDRTSMIKPFSQLQSLPKESVDVEMDSILKRYKRRPKSMELMCYAEFASWYEVIPKQREKKSVNVEAELPETEYVHDQEDDIAPIIDEIGGKVVQLPCGTCLKKRKCGEIIYTNTTPINKDMEEHFRQKLMLYTHWRDDERDFIAGYDNYEQCLTSKILEINAI